MRSFFTLGAFLLCVACATGQENPLNMRYDLPYNPDFYSQKTPKDALTSVILAIERKETQYLAAHLLDPTFIDERLKATQEYYERFAAEQLAKMGSEGSLTGAALQARIRQKGTIYNFNNLSTLIQKKLADEPDNFKEMRQFLRSGEITEDGETAKIAMKDVKDRALYFKKIGSRWYLENRKEEIKPKEEPKKE